ncbi:hypothetical protein KO516_14525 [Citreicella sp. C3M06]|uniref:hypothetical protein n=1 Tax=Citreicella sp. C3M06 TaxID=2841564 RepID=UPI001C085141|nr:hypothetical protein [Citreicella sp. C3M06]
MVFALVAKRRYIWPASWMRVALGVSRPGYYVSVVLDPFSRRAVGWSTQSDRDASLIMDALIPCGTSARQMLCRAVDGRLAPRQA